MTKDQEEFDKLVKKIYALADKMGQRITITMRRKPAVAPKPGAMAGSPAEAESSRRCEPGDE